MDNLDKIGLGLIIGAIISAALVWIKFKSIVKNEIVEPMLANFVTEINALKESISNLKVDIKEDIARLETKQDKYNHLQERVTRTEESCKSAHLRINRLEDKCN